VTQSDPQFLSVTSAIVLLFGEIWFVSSLSVSNTAAACLHTLQHDIDMTYHATA